MKLNVLIAFLFLTSFLAMDSGTGLPGRKEKKEITRLWGESSTIQMVEVKSSVRDSIILMMEWDEVYRINLDNELKGFMLSTQKKGRFDFFDYSLFYTKDLSVLKVLVTTYREDHGAAVSNKGWLKQFSGYNGGKLLLGKDINAISGATISATSMVMDIQRCQQLMGTMKELNLIE